MTQTASECIAAVASSGQYVYARCGCGWEGQRYYGFTAYGQSIGSAHDAAWADGNRHDGWLAKWGAR